MSSICGKYVHLSLFGQSHAEAVGMTLDGLPAGIQIDRSRLQRFLNRRAPGRNSWSTTRREEDVPEFICGLKNDTTCGAPLTVIIRNKNTRPEDYSQLEILPRPGHADYAAQLKYHGYQDVSGGGHFSGRLTAPLCVAGGILLQELERKNISVRARIHSIGTVVDDSPFISSVADRVFPAVDDKTAAQMQNVIMSAKENGDSVGGIIECVIEGMPGGYGEPIFDGAESRFAQVLFAIPAVKGVEFGSGFKAAEIPGSQNNDAFCICEDGKIGTLTNQAGGILGGITNGMPIVFRVAFKPTPSISRTQQSVNLKTMKIESLCLEGRHDPCIVPRAVPVVEAAAAFVTYDLLQEGMR